MLRRPAAEFGDTYHAANVVITATHTQAAPGGTPGHPMVDDRSIPDFRPVRFEANVAGIVDAARIAHHDLAPSGVGVTTGALHDAGDRRSRGSSDRDTAEERTQFPAGIDPRSQSLQITRDGRLVGVLNWFGVHAISMTSHNTIATSDNKNFAAWHREREVAGQDYLDASTPELATAFAQTHPGDVSPKLDLSPGRGPTPDEWLNTRIIGERQSPPSWPARCGPGRRCPPNSDLRRGDTYLAVERREGAGGCGCTTTATGLVHDDRVRGTTDRHRRPHHLGRPTGHPGRRIPRGHPAPGRGIGDRLFPMRAESLAFDVC